MSTVRDFQYIPPQYQKKSTIEIIREASEQQKIAILNRAADYISQLRQDTAILAVLDLLYDHHPYVYSSEIGKILGDWQQKTEG